MKRFHVHVAVENLADSIRFYSKLFGSEPSVEKIDYAKWLLEDPRINFAISSRGNAVGVNHLGFQVDSNDELTGMKAQLNSADSALVEQCATACCYARSDKYWVKDPSGIAWETFHTLGAIPVFGESSDDKPLGSANEDHASCCAPSQDQRAKGACCG
ncbi:MAG TPA: ArsI/CadI family heavy metal resistance metalloenzyme [Steroidobacteraceae bacterium]|nr:ArsI/CadI family heavy metal resistance metalloenzyme [Steroidobacteraceae bacterium]